VKLKEFTAMQRYFILQGNNLTIIKKLEGKPERKLGIKNDENLNNI
jgi:hypothetical protein